MASAFVVFVARILVAILNAVVVVVAGKSTKGTQKEAETHFTFVEKINAKRLKKQLPHKLRYNAVCRFPFPFPHSL